MAAVQALYQMELSGASAETVQDDLAAGRLPAAEAGPADCEVDQALFRIIIENAVAKQAGVDTEIARALSEGWKLERIDAVARAILRAGVVELWACKATPSAVIINEYVEVAKDFFEGPEPGFVNAALQACAHRVRDTAMPDSSANEFEIIARYFAPLATHAGARGLLDDAALIATEGPVVITTDAIVEGVHFLRDDPLDQVARKALRVNLSDLAAKGSSPFGYLLTLFWPEDRPASDIATLAAGLAADQAEYGLALLGGDTVSTPGPLSLSVTMLGHAGPRTPSRSSAKPGDGVWVTGTIGDSGLGLAALRGEPFDKADHDYFVDRYRLPSPRLDLAAAVAELASATMDVSDGLIGDAAKIAAASGVRIEIDLGAVPLSPAAARWIERQPDPLKARARPCGVWRRLRDSIYDAGSVRSWRDSHWSGFERVGRRSCRRRAPGNRHSGEWLRSPGRPLTIRKAASGTLPVMRPASLLPPFLILGIAMAAAAPARASEGGGDAKKEQTADRKMSAPNVVTPVVRNGKLVNYLFVSVDVELKDGADAIKLRDRAHFLRDALLRASHRTPLADPNDDYKLNFQAANPVFWQASIEALGAQNVKKVSITGVDSLKRR